MPASSYMLKKAPRGFPGRGHTKWMWIFGMAPFTAHDDPKWVKSSEDGPKKSAEAQT